VIVFLENAAAGYRVVLPSVNSFLPDNGVLFRASSDNPAGRMGLSSSSVLDRLVAEFGAGLLELKSTEAMLV
jgi:hypothetical protein